MRDWVPVPAEPLPGSNITVTPPSGIVRRVDTLVPNKSTEIVELVPGRWTVRNDSDRIVRLQADSANSQEHINTLLPYELCGFDWTYGRYKLTAKILSSAQVFDRASMDTDAWTRSRKELNMGKWEYLFYRYMVAADTACRRIPEGPDKTPDFTIVLGNGTVPVEFKEFAPNDDEKRNEELVSDRGYGDVVGNPIGHRLAKSVGGARSQLRSFLRQNGDGPAILAIMDPHGLDHAGPEHSAALLEGSLTVEFSAADGSLNVYRREDRNHLPHERNSILSAIAVFKAFGHKSGAYVDSETESGGEDIVVDLAVYHNPRAEHPLPPDQLASFGFPQYVVDSVGPRRVHLAPRPSSPRPDRED